MLLKPFHKLFVIGVHGSVQFVGICDIALVFATTAGRNRQGSSIHIAADKSINFAVFVTMFVLFVKLWSITKALYFRRSETSRLIC